MAKKKNKPKKSRSGMSGSEARKILASLTPSKLRYMPDDELIRLLRAGQNEIRNDIRRFKKAGVSSPAIRVFKEQTHEHKYETFVPSLKRPGEKIKKIVVVKPEILTFSKINVTKSRGGLEQYASKLASYFNPSTVTNTVEGIQRNNRYVLYHMFGGRVIYGDSDNSTHATDWIPAKETSQENIDKWFSIYNAYRKHYGDAYAAMYKELARSLTYNLENGFTTPDGTVIDLFTMSPDEAAEWLSKHGEFIDDPSGTVSGDDAVAGDGAFL